MLIKLSELNWVPVQKYILYNALVIKDRERIKASRGPDLDCGPLYPIEM